MGDIDFSGVAYLAVVGIVAVAVLAIVVPGAIVGGVWWAVQQRLGLPWDGQSVGLAVSGTSACVVALHAFSIFRR